jgi:hypothetical protein
VIANKNYEFKNITAEMIFNELKITMINLNPIGKIKILNIIINNLEKIAKIDF